MRKIDEQKGISSSCVLSPPSSASVDLLECSICRFPGHRDRHLSNTCILQMQNTFNENHLNKNQMNSKLEALPNEIFLSIFSHLSWDEILISLWSLNKRLNSLICSTLSTTKNGIIFNRPGLSYRRFSFRLFPLILNSSCLSSSIKSIHFDGINSFSFDFTCEQIFYHNGEQRICFPNLKSLYITQCLISQPLVQILTSLIQYQLNDLTLTFHKDNYEIFNSKEENLSSGAIQEKRTNMFQQILCQIFSHQCQLTSLQLDISESALYSIHLCLKSHSHLSSKTINDGFQSYCITLRRLKVHLNYTCFLEDLIEHVPNLEQLSVHCPHLQRSTYSDNENSILPNGNWFNKVPKLKCFTLESSVDNDYELSYLKWLLNNVNHVRRLELILCSDGIRRRDQYPTIWNPVIDANFLRQYYLPDEIIHLKYFHFYIRAKCQLLSNDVEKIINSFQIHPCFISHQWTNVKCFHEDNEYRSYQHIFSPNIKKFQFSDRLINYPCIYRWSDIHHIKICLCPSLYSFLEQFDKLCPNASCITINPGGYLTDSEKLMSLEIEIQMEQFNLNNIQLRNVTKLLLGPSYKRSINPCRELTDGDKIVAKVFAHIISMCIQLKYLFIGQFQWFVYITQYALVDLRKDALSTVRHAEFRIPSCHMGGNHSIHIGKHLVPLLRTYIPNLQTLCLWRPDDFPWTSIRPDIDIGGRRRARYGILVHRWYKTLKTSESIAQHVTVFEENLCGLFAKLNQLVYLDIYAKIPFEKVEPYRLMVQNRFRNSRIDIRMSRFRLWK